MYETIKKYKLLSLLIFFIWIGLVYSYIYNIKESYKSSAFNDLKEKLTISNSINYNFIGKEYFDRAINKNAISEEEYTSIQDQLTQNLDFLDVDSFAVGLPVSGEYYLTMVSFATNDTRFKKIKYFTPYVEKIKPTQSLKNKVLELLKSDRKVEYFLNANISGKFYSKVEKRYLSNGKTILIFSSYSIKKFNALLKKNNAEENNRMIYLILLMLPLFLYLIFVYFTEKSQLQNKLLYNYLTGLKNSNSLLKTKLINKSALLYIDIEFFTEYNRLYGHEIGDRLIKEFSIALKNYKNSHNYSYYTFNGNDFGVLIKNITQDDINHEVKNLFDYLSRCEFKIDKNLTIMLSTKIGVSFSEDMEILLENASSACSIAKQKGLHYYFYNEVEDTKNHLKTLAKLLHAINTDNVKVFYQPIINKSKKIIKYEALIRMNDNGQYLSPFEFLHIAKLSGHYYDLTMIVLKQVILDVEKHKIQVSFNLSYEDISNTKHADMIINLLTKSKYRNYLTVELLESSAIENFSILLSFINQIKKLGLKVAIDDYGAEYSSMENILKIKPDFLKIDASIVKNIVHDKASLTVLSTITNMAQSLDMEVIAEYVATEEIFNLAKSVNVDMFQGYYYSEPKPLSELL